MSRNHTIRWALMLIACLGLPLPALAAADKGCDQISWETVQFQLPSQITIPANPSPGTVLWTSAATAPNGPALTPSCKGQPRNGLQNHINANPASGDILDTYVPGLGYRIIRTDLGRPIRLYSVGDTMPPGNTFNLSYQLQLVWTKAIAPGASLGGYELATWNIAANQGDSYGWPIVDFQSTGMATVTSASCDVTTDPTVVTLPTVTSSAFGSAGATSGSTRFNVKLNCQGGGAVNITLAANQPVSSSVLSNTGSATGVGVQLLYNNLPVTFGSAIPLGNAPTGPLSIPFDARYYQTGGTIPGGGSVQATATYTLTYP